MPKLPAFVTGFMAVLLNGTKHGTRASVFNGAVDEAIPKFPFQVWVFTATRTLR